MPASPRSHAIDLSFLAEIVGQSRRLNSLIDALRTAIRTGALAGNVVLPSSRRLADELSLARSTVAAAYERLISEGYLTARQGAGTWVCAGMRSAPLPWPPRTLVRGSEIRICRPSLAKFPHAEWRRALLGASSRVLTYDEGEPMGDPDLRREIAAYVGRARGLSVSPDAVMVTRGGTQAIELVFRECLAQGDRIAIEDPGYPLARDLARVCGAKPVPVPLDDEGLRVEVLIGLPRLRAVYTTPSHQFPLGMRLSLPRRQALLAWARKAGALIVEDDYDGEFRYDAPPLPPLASLPDAEGHVVYVGTFAKSFSPALRLGYLITNTALVARIAKRRLTSGDTGQPLSEAAMARFLAAGEIDRHVRRMRWHYDRIRRLLVEGLCTLLPDAEIGGVEAGLHLTLFVKRDQAEHVLAAGRKTGMFIDKADRFQFSPIRRSLPLVIGYGPVEPQAISAFLHELELSVKISQRRRTLD
jgi:GntR family transcriptional regulator / MocR family aminotransferase